MSIDKYQIQKLMEEDYQTALQIKNKYLQKDLINPLPIKQLPEQGQLFKDYSSLCNYLGIPIVGGNAKKKQLLKLKTLFELNQVPGRTAYKIGTIYPHPTPLLKLGVGNLGNYMTKYDYLFYIVLLYLIKFAPRDEKNPHCIAISKSQLKRDYFKLFNQDYYSIRGDKQSVQSITYNTGLSKEILSFSDVKVTNKTNQMINQGIKQLEKRSLIYISKRLYIYYEEILPNGIKTGIQRRPATDEEIKIILAAGYKSQQDLEDEYKNSPDLKKKYGVDLYKYIKEKQLSFLNNVKQYSNERNENWINIADKIQLHLPESIVDGEREIDPYDMEIEKVKQQINIIIEQEKLLGIQDDNNAAIMGSIETLPGVQYKLNQYMIEWARNSAKKEWSSAEKKLPLQEKTKTQDIVAGIETFIENFIDITNTDSSFVIEEYPQQIGEEEWVVWKVWYSPTVMKFTNENLRGDFFKKIKKVPIDKEFILWGVPHEGMVCSNCSELIDLARQKGKKEGWLPIIGYLGGVWLDKGEGKEYAEMECFILALGNKKMLELKEEWSEKQEKQEK